MGNGPLRGACAPALAAALLAGHARWALGCPLSFLACRGLGRGRTLIQGGLVQLGKRVRFSTSPALEPSRQTVKNEVPGQRGALPHWHPLFAPVLLLILMWGPQKADVPRSRAKKLYSPAVGLQWDQAWGKGTPSNPAPINTSQSPPTPVLSWLLKLFACP